SQTAVWSCPLTPSFRRLRPVLAMNQHALMGFRHGLSVDFCERRQREPRAGLKLVQWMTRGQLERPGFGRVFILRHNARFCAAEERTRAASDRLAAGPPD